MKRYHLRHKFSMEYCRARYLWCFSTAWYMRPLGDIIRKHGFIWSVMLMILSSICIAAWRNTPVHRIHQNRGFDYYCTIVSLSAALTWENLQHRVSGGRLCRQMVCPGWAGGHTVHWRTTAHKHPQTHTNYTSEQKTQTSKTRMPTYAASLPSACVFVWPFIPSLSQVCVCVTFHPLAESSVCLCDLSSPRWVKCVCKEALLSADPSLLGALRRTVFHSVSNRARRKRSSLLQLCMLSTRFLFSRARDCTIFTLHSLSDFYVERVTAHRIRYDHSCFHNLWPNYKTKLKLKPLWEQGGSLLFRGPTQLAYSAFREDRLWLFFTQTALWLISFFACSEWCI